MAVSERPPSEPVSYSVIISLIKELLTYLGVPWHEAPGEAEAECVQLEKAHVVDAVVTKDGDAFVFGGSRVLFPLGSVSGRRQAILYQFQDLNIGDRPLTLEDLMLCTMLCGSDYHSGISNCGGDLAIQIVSAGYAASYFVSRRLDLARVREWKEDLCTELRINDKGRFMNRNSDIATKITAARDNFPDIAALNLYMSPRTSTVSDLQDTSRSWWKVTADVGQM